MAIKIDYFDTSNDDDANKQENNGRLHARDCIFNLMTLGTDIFTAVQMLREEVNDANWVGNTSANFHFGTAFLQELHFISEDHKKTFVTDLESCFRLPAVMHLKDQCPDAFFPTRKDFTL